MSLAIQGSRLAASRISKQVIAPIPVNDWSGIGDHVPNSDRSLSTSRQRLNFNGTLQSVSIVTKSGSPVDGRIHCRVVLEDEDKNELATLCMGYQYPGHEVWGAGAMGIKLGDRIRLESRSSLSGVQLNVRGRSLIDVYGTGGWTGMMQGSTEGDGFMRQVSVADPAAGVATITESVPTNAKWQLISWRSDMLADANPANREFRLNQDDGTASAEFLTRHTGVSQTAGQLRKYCWAVDIGTQDGNVERAIVRPIPNVTLRQGSNIIVSFKNVQAGDQLSNTEYYVREWIEEN